MQCLQSKLSLGLPHNRHHAAVLGRFAPALHHRPCVSVQATNLREKKCEPCEASHDALDHMGLAMVMDQETAEKFRAQARKRLRHPFGNSHVAPVVVHAAIVCLADRRGAISCRSVSGMKQPSSYITLREMLQGLVSGDHVTLCNWHV